MALPPSDGGHVAAAAGRPVTPSDGRHVVVVGGGISGLAAALQAAEAGAEVTVLEAGDGTGGMLVSSPFAGRVVDEGADAFLIRTPAALDLARRVGLGDDLIHPAERRAHVWSRGELHELGPQLMGVPLDLDAVAASGLLSPDGLARLRAEATLGPTPLPDHDVAIADALGARLGPEAVERLVDPLVGGINGGDTARQSLAAVVPQLDAAARDPDHASLIEACRAQVAAAARTSPGPDAPIFAAPRGGMARFPEAVADAALATGRVTIRTAAPVAGLHLGPGAAPTVEVALVDGTTLVADAAVVATPAHVAARLLEPLDAEVAALVAGIEHASVAFARLAFPLDALGRPLTGSGVLVPRVEGRTVTACSWTSAKWAELAPERGDGTFVVRAAVGRDGDQDALALDDDALLDRIVADLGEVIGVRGAPAASGIRRWTDAFPQYRPGHLDLVAAIEAGLAARSPAVALAGMYLRGVGIPASVASAQAAVDRVLGAVGSA